MGSTRNTLYLRYVFSPEFSMSVCHYFLSILKDENIQGHMSNRAFIPVNIRVGEVLKSTPSSRNTFELRDNVTMCPSTYFRIFRWVPFELTIIPLQTAQCSTTKPPRYLVLSAVDAKYRLEYMRTSKRYCL